MESCSGGGHVAGMLEIVRNERQEVVDCPNSFRINWQRFVMTIFMAGLHWGLVSCACQIYRQPGSCQLSASYPAASRTADSYWDAGCQLPSCQLHPATSSAASAQAVVIWQSDSFQGQYNQALAASVKGCVVCKAVRTAETCFRPHFPLLIKTWSEYLNLGEKFGPKLKLLLAAAEPVSEFKELMVPPAWQHPRTSQLLRGGSAGRLVVQGFRLFTLFYYQD